MGVHLTFDQEPTRPHQVRVCPANFAEVFIRGGWSAVRAEFGLNSRTERRCLEECGADELLAKRREHVAKVRKLRKAAQRRHEKPEPVQPVPDSVREAIAFLRSRDGGGWLITATGVGDYFFGAIRITASELLARAERKGFAASVAVSARRKAG